MPCIWNVLQNHAKAKEAWNCECCESDVTGKVEEKADFFGTSERASDLIKVEPIILNFSNNMDGSATWRPLTRVITLELEHEFWDIMHLVKTMETLL